MSKDTHAMAGGMRNSGSGVPDGWSRYRANSDAAATVEAATAHDGGVVVPAMQVMTLGTMAVVLDVGNASIGVWPPGGHQGFGVMLEPGTPGWLELHPRDYDASVRSIATFSVGDTHIVADTPEFRYRALGKGESQRARIMDASTSLADGAPAKWSVYFVSADAEATAAAVVELGGAAIDPPQDAPYGRLATFVDTTGTQQFKLSAAI